MENETLSKLEAVVKKMLGNIDELKSENGSLQSQIQTKDAKIEELESKISAMTSDQDAINTRVSSLISSIEEWEKNDEKVVAETTQSAEIPESAIEASKEKQEGQLFDMGE